MEEHTDDRFRQEIRVCVSLFSEIFPKEAKAIWKLNDLRNDIFHGRAIRDAKFDGQAISEEATVESIFQAAQFGSMQLGEFEEMMDDDRYEVTKKWKARIAKWLAEHCQ